MKSIDSKGQTGEDITHILASVFFIVVILLTLNYAFTSRLLDSMETDIYERLWILAEDAASRWAFNDSTGSHQLRLLDKGKICVECSNTEDYRVSYRVKDLTDKKELCSCGPVLNESKAVILPSAIRINETETYLGIIEVRIER